MRPISRCTFAASYIFSALATFCAALARVSRAVSSVKKYRMAVNATSSVAIIYVAFASR